MVKYDKDEIKEKLDTDKVFDIVRDFGGEPKMTDFGFIAATICHNHPGDGSHKLYYYTNTRLCRCFTGCDCVFDIFELINKIHQQNGEATWGLYDSVRWVASRFGWGPTIVEDATSSMADWEILGKYDKLNALTLPEKKNQQLPVYDTAILEHLAYPIIAPWEKEGIKRDVIRRNLIGFYPTDNQITIPHFDIDGRFVGLRGRTLVEEEEKWGKYRPLHVGHEWYNHALGWNLYNIQNSKKQIEETKKAIIFEGEKSCLLYQSYFGPDNDISVACCGSSVSNKQMDILMGLGVREISIAFDRQFQKKNDDEFKKLVKNLKAINDKYGQYVVISFLFDKDDKLPYKASPIDVSSELFLTMYKNRIIL